jgi:hypothetical protein
MLDEGVAQPLLVTTSAITLASETVRSILKIDDIVSFGWLLLIFNNYFKFFFYCQVNALY